MRIANRPILQSAALTVALVLPAVAQASKEVFHRDKPHVNVGLIGHVNSSSESLSLTLSLAVLPSSTEGTVASLLPRCSGSFDIRILESSALEGPAVFQRTVDLEQNGSYSVDVPRQDFSSPLLYAVMAKGENIDGRHCVFRGLVEVQSDYAATRAYPCARKTSSCCASPSGP